MSYLVSVEDIDEVTKRAKVKIPKEEFLTGFQQQLAEIQKSANIKGFRKGKAPIDLVKKMYGKEVQFDVRRDLIAKATESVLKETEITPATNVEIIDIEKHLKRESQDEDIEFEVEIPVNPDLGEITLDKDNINIEVELYEDINEDVLLKQIGDILEAKANYEDIDRDVVEKGDYILVKFAVFDEGNTGDELKNEEVKEDVIWLGDSNMPEEFQQLVGAKVGEKKIISYVVAHKNNSDDKEHKHEYRAYVEILGIKNRVVPELTDEFVEKHFKNEASNAEEFKNKLKEMMQKQVERANKQKIADAVLEHLIKRLDVKVHKAVIEQAARDQLLRNPQFADWFRNNKGADISPFIEQIKDQVTKLLQSQLIFSALLNQTGLRDKIDSKQLESEIVERFRVDANLQSAISDEEVKKFLSSKEGENYKRDYEGKIIFEKLGEDLAKRVKLTEKRVPIRE